ncbi:hypothetical protein [Kitasatospora sp. NPDC057198]|uniref:hypothetical protein n=1 Tax=Kitasatospora sp. NPDC057198 TaxID=3346046 RepID=UPI00363DCF67
MNVRFVVHLVGTLALVLVLTFGGFVLGGPLVGRIGLVLWLVLASAVRALLPPAYHYGTAGAEPTSATYRGWAAKLVARTPLGRNRTPEDDLARLAAGVRLCLFGFALRAGNETHGHLLLQRTPDGGTEVSWQGRRKDGGPRPAPISPAVPLFRPGREQLNASQARYGYTSSVQFGRDTYWLRGHDAEVIRLALGTPPATASDSGRDVTGPATAATA